ncbi:MAG: DUF5615 family PIN-like protein [Pseudomonadota bacterium]
MKVLLDENFPLSLYRRLREKGFDAEHVIELGQRGIPDSALRARLEREELVFLTNDTEFENIPADLQSQVVVSRLPQRLPTARRVELWTKALEQLASRRPAQRLLEITPDGELVAWEIKEGIRRPVEDG